MPISLILHAGHHKTATSSFQKLCSNIRPRLLEKKIYFPTINNDGNMYIACYAAQKGDWSIFENLLQNGINLLEGNGTILLSAEDLENALYDHKFAKKLSYLAELKGINSVRWIFVNRNQFDYFESLYAQLSKDGQILRYDIMAKHILKNGIFSCSIPRYQWHFIFDYNKYYTDFRENVSKNIEIYTMDIFVDEFIGAPILNPLGITADLFLTSPDIKIIKENKRMANNDVETRYICRMLGIPYNKNSIIKANNLIKPLTQIRMQGVKNIRDSIKNKFQVRFGF
jgi:hypothetical protein